MNKLVRPKAVVSVQGDQMSLLKIRPKCSPIHFLPKSMHNLTVGKSIPKIRATFVIFNNNNYPMG
jgi:hypothetical protein